MKSCAFVTNCWEKDWKLVLLEPDYLKVRQIENHGYHFDEKLLLINNVSDLDAVKRAADIKIREGVLTSYLVISEIEEELLSFFHLKRSDFRMGSNASQYDKVSHDWIYYNALGPLAAIYSGNTDYLLYLTGDVRLDRRLKWIAPSMRMMERNPNFKVANPVWNHQYKEARLESYRKTWNFFIANQGFSDQIFLVRRNDFKQPIYGEIRPDSDHFPRGDVFEKRIFSYMKNRGWERIIYRRGSYIHENVK